MYVVKMDEEGRITIPQEIISAQGFGKDTAFLVANVNYPPTKVSGLATIQ